ncbi:MAG TPA: TlpA disulfide reductase family protein, partial [Planctomycetota bacterium]|nr:TlpA disulfide reductase family protein [Planctomycetota bacterium]
AIRLDALEWFAQASPARARPFLESAEKLPGAPGRAARRIRRRLDAAEKLKVGLPPIPFRAKSIGGDALAPEAFAGKVLVIQFWSSANADSLREAAELKSLHRELHASGLEIVGVNLDRGRIRSVPGGREPAGDGAEGVARFAADFEMPWPQVHDGEGWNGDMPELFGVAALPFTVVVDRHGVVRALGAPADALRASVRELVAEK